MANDNVLGENNVKGRAIGVGLVAAIVAAGLWTLVVLATDYEIGYMALGVGALVGYSMLYASGKRGGKQLQIAAAVLSVVGVLLAKYMIFSYFLAKELATYSESAGTGFFDVLLNYNTPIFMAEIATELFSGFDILWVLLAVNIAWKATAFSQAVEEVKPELKKVLADTEVKLGEVK